ncbi:MAG TPA: ABC transporter ATP-binding protein [Gammaproteobacteria bacterium]|nr:ABC transporter ATP-binding protein [Gammaproteobacteria bacterium]
MSLARPTRGRGALQGSADDARRADASADERTSTDRPLLEVVDLHVEFDTYGGVVQAVRGVSFEVEAGRTLAIVGESGCGKSVTVQSIMGLVPMPPGRITRGTALLDGIDVIRQKIVGGEDIRGNRVGMIFQDPMSSLNPTMTVGAQIAETLQVHRGYAKARAYARAVELLALTHIPEAEKRARQYPFAFSGGMLQRAMIAIAIACEPDLLIADEPTTALDVTIQAQILELLKELQRRAGMAIVLITHDLGVVARMADEVAVMYAGEIVERGGVEEVFYRPAHPYTLGLRRAMPSDGTTKAAGLEPIEGSPPDLFRPPSGCGYFARCPHAMRLCEQHHPPVFEVQGGHGSRCWLQHPAAPASVPDLYTARDGAEIARE